MSAREAASQSLERNAGGRPGSSFPHSALAASVGLPKSAEGEPVFAEPWQATVFAMTVRLHQQAVFSWADWAEALSAEVHKPGRCADGSDYYDCWVAALSGLLTRLSVASDRELEALTHSWQRAAEATPHGKPIRLENDPLRRG